MKRLLPILLALLVLPACGGSQAEDTELIIFAASSLQGALTEIGAELALAAGGVAISAGVWLIYPPAGLIAGGALAIGAALLVLLGGDGP